MIFGLTKENMTNLNVYIYLKLAVACVSSCIFFTACENNVNEVKAQSLEALMLARMWRYILAMMERLAPN